MQSTKELRSLEKLMSELKKIVDGGTDIRSNFYSYAENVSVTNEFSAKVKDRPQERRPGLGIARKKASFSLKTRISHPSLNLEPTLDIDHLEDPDLFFDAYERNENAKKEIQKQLGGNKDNIDLYKPSNKERPPFLDLEFLDELDPKCHEYRWNVVLSFHPPFNGPVHSSANGLLLLCTPGSRPWNLILCNPVTRDYIKLPCPRESKSDFLPDILGLGVSRMSEQIKLVRIFYVMQGIRVSEKPFESECQVYTVGTGSWRRIGSTGLLHYHHEYGAGVFLNGNFHWLAHAAAGDLNGPPALISCFDLETELFSSFSPPHPCDDSDRCSSNLSVLRDCLCLCSTGENDTDIWLMKEYGEEKSWTRELSSETRMMKFLTPSKFSKTVTY